ncbi:hypothetical protein FLL45_15020 [Aliikangiella marina]|uniref:Transposase n=1 Tax=Aliikangiella marina TaxID=1712262 RepID=A0A545T6C8_9GAMM|nr:hypothetical protein [Aliikangiella marina]TQV72779.1 hypothetical protein FLL45_15020 [Aliikangiella marina]
MLAEYRLRLGSLSWLMRCINEPIAKRSNREDCVKGHFWESRFASQALLDEAAALTCMAYVDLNPIRAGVTDKLEDCEYTSIQTRLSSINEEVLQQTIKSIAGKIRERTMTLSLKRYIELVEWTGKSIVYPGKGKVPSHIIPVLERLNINQDNWLKQVDGFGRNYYRVVGPAQLLQRYTERFKLNWVKGVSAVRSLYLSPT